MSKTLLDAETRYSPVEKLALALVMASRKLRPYFQSHPIQVVTSHPLKAIFQKPDLSGRLVKWAIELGQYDVSYIPRTAIKSQVLADFTAEFAPDIQIGVARNLICMSNELIPDTWILYVDGSTHSKGTGLGVVIQSPTGDTMEQSFQCTFRATNNEAEYEALIIGMRLLVELGAQDVEVRCDSQLVSKQVQGEYQVKDS